MARKNRLQTRFSRPHIGSGSDTCCSIMARIRFLRSSTALPSSTTPNIQYSTVGFHLMKVSLWKISVAPPNTTMMSSDSHCMASTLRCLNHTHAICATVATIATVVAT